MNGQTATLTPARRAADTTPAHAPDRPRPAPEAAAPAPLPSEQLLQGRKTIEISHNGTLYRLQATKLGKLILTK